MADANRKAPRLNEAKFSYITDEVILNDEIIYVGEMVQKDDSTLEVAAATAVSGVFVLGVSTKYVDNAADGETLNFISTAIHGMVNDGSITAKDRGEVAYVLDAATVSISAASAATTNVAGRIVDVDASYVYVDFDPSIKG
jgi:hypothetical protein